ncbi:type II secretion system secretin GspD [Pelagibius sp. 7325]|uniref:type II secretion system secretin GspD n=1 Tax=Pelagibius sp. 7325 TaxID=3131994 RepID=UPI0030ED3B2F
MLGLCAGLLGACTERETYGEPYDPLAAYDRRVAAGDDLGEVAGPPRSPDAGTAAAERVEDGPVEGVFRGSGQVVRPVPASGGVISNPDGAVSLNFGVTDLREIVDAVLGQTLGLNYTLDQGVEGAMQLRTSRPIARADVLPMLENALNAAGAALIEADGVYHVVPSTAARGAVAPARGRGGRAAGIAVQVIPLRFASAKTLAETLKGFVPERASLTANAGRNVLLASGSGQDVRNLAELIDLFDVDYLEGMSYALAKLDYAPPSDVVKELQAVFGDPEAGPTAGVVDFVPLERLSSLLVISPQSDYIAKALLWIDRFDRQGDGEGRQVFVYRVQNRKASELAAILDGVFGSGRTTVGDAAPIAPGQTVATLTGRGALPATAAQNALGREGATAGAAQSSALLTPTVAPTVDDVVTVRGEGTLRTEAGVRVIADEANNALTILATTQDYRKVEHALAQLDVLPLQVLIEATIAEVTLNDELRYGVQWFLESGDFSATLSNVASGAVDSTFPGFSAVFGGLGDDARIVLDALDEITKVRVLSSPQLMVLNNRTAVLQVGDQVPILVQTAEDVGDDNTTVVNSIEYQDTGVILRVTPRVNESGLVTLDVQQEVSDVTETISSGIDSPTIQQRFFESSVAVESGTTIALGGLIEDRRETGESGLPLLSQVPVLGNLFKTTTNGVSRTELLVLLTPRVVRNNIEVRELTQELRKRLTAFEIKGAREEEETLAEPVGEETSGGAAASP